MVFKKNILKTEDEFFLSQGNTPHGRLLLLGREGVTLIVLLKKQTLRIRNHIKAINLRVNL
jgi:hypothetical protein